jgi:hypothetical protein
MVVVSRLRSQGSRDPSRVWTVVRTRGFCWSQGSYETAWTWLHKLRRAMVRPGRNRLTGRVAEPLLQNLEVVCAQNVKVCSHWSFFWLAVRYGSVRSCPSRSHISIDDIQTALETTCYVPRTGPSPNTPIISTSKAVVTALAWQSIGASPNRPRRSPPQASRMVRLPPLPRISKA